MKSQTARFLTLLVISMLISGIVLACWDLFDLWRTVSIAHSTIRSITGHAAQSTTISIVVAHGLIPIGQVEHPYLVTAVVDFLLGAVVGALAFLLIYGIYWRLRRFSTPHAQ